MYYLAWPHSRKTATFYVCRVWDCCFRSSLSNMISILLSNLFILLAIDINKLLIPNPQTCPSESFLSWWMATSVIPGSLCGSLEAEFLVFALKKFQLIGWDPPTLGRVIAVHQVYWFKCRSQCKTNKQTNKKPSLFTKQLNNMALLSQHLNSPPQQKIEIWPA